MTNQIEKRPGNLEKVDPFHESINSLIVVAFPRSNSQNFAFALSIAQLANHYAVTEISSKTMHFAAFARTQDDAGKASALLKCVSGWKGTMIFSSGKLIPNNYQVSQVIECFLASCSCRDSKAHCHKIIDDPFSNRIQNLSVSISIRLSEHPPLKEEVKIDRYAFPCKYLSNWFRFQRDHPSSPQNQIQAAGVSKGCDICPHFKPEDFQIVGTRTIVKDFFD